MGIYSSSAFTYSTKNYIAEKVYDLDTPVYIVFEDHTALFIEYYFYSQIYIDYLNLSNDKLKKLFSNYKLDLPVDGKIIDVVYFDSFYNEYCIDSAKVTPNSLRKKYFGKITFRLNGVGGDRFLICAEDSLMDGYMDVWYEESYKFND